jgi:hypothetical protein
VWLERPLDEQRPLGQDRQRLDPRKVLGIMRSTALSSLPRGTVILSTELEGGAVKAWRVDGYAASVEPDLLRVILVPTTDFA